MQRWKILQIIEYLLCHDSIFTKMGFPVDVLFPVTKSWLKDKCLCVVLIDTENEETVSI